MVLFQVLLFPVGLFLRELPLMLLYELVERSAFGGVRPRISPIITPPATTTVPIAPIIIFLLLSIGSSFFICNKIIIPETHGQGLKKNLQIREGKEKQSYFSWLMHIVLERVKKVGARRRKRP